MESSWLAASETLTHCIQSVIVNDVHKIILTSRNVLDAYINLHVIGGFQKLRS